MKKPKKKTPKAVAIKSSLPRNLTPSMCQRLRHDLLAACRQVADTHGLAVEGGDLSDIDLRHGFNIGFRVGIPMDDGALFSHEKTLFEALAPSFGLDPSDYGRTFRTDGDAFRLTAINPNRPKYPISAERIADGRGFKFTAENVAIYLKASN
ncbi:MAG: hypothetical protein AAFY03_05455 [Pseudomonadota bacterium]